VRTPIAATHPKPSANSAATLALAIPLGFFALRAFGETLARYDPLS
jgi:hypothetical protein